MEPCDLNPESISLLVKGHLLPNSEGEGWRETWGSECLLQEGVTLRIPYDPNEINATDVSPQPEDEPSITEGDDPPAEDRSQEASPSTDPVADAPPEDQAPPPNPEEADMPEETPSPAETPAELAAYEAVDPAPNLAGDLNALAQTTGGDSLLTVILALVAVLGGGAAWKFYRQHSEQKHEQEMQRMKLEAKAKGMEGEPPGPCKEVHTQLKAEVEQMKSTLDKLERKMSINADFDGEDADRRIRKLERWRRSLDEDEDE